MRGIVERGGASRAGHFTVSVSALHDESGNAAGVIISAIDITAQGLAGYALRRNDERIRWQTLAFQAAVDGAPLELSLDLLARMAIVETMGSARTAFYIADADGSSLHPVWGAGNMDYSYLELVDRFAIREDSVTCGLAIATNDPVITADVFEEPRWAPWLPLAESHRFRACWSFPISRRQGRAVGTFAMYFGDRREPDARDLALADAVTRAAAVIIASYAETRERARAEAAHHQSDARFGALADLVPDLLWESGDDGSSRWFNARWYEYTGQSLEDARGSGWMEAIHPEDRERSAIAHRAAMESGSPLVQEHRIRGADGSYRWFLVRAEPQHDERGHIARWFGAATDIHAHHTALADVAQQVEQRTAELSDASAALIRAAEERDSLRRQLVEAEEVERRRLARELHDQLGQQLTGFTLWLSDVRRLMAERKPVDERLDQLEVLSQDMARDARLLALELRPPELDDIGLHSALDTYVEHWARRAGVEAELTVSDAVAHTAIPGDVSTAIYRIVQEALNNVAKYAGAKHVSVVLDKPNVELRLVVEDDGQGFDVAAVTARVRRDRRLGLAGMIERATLLGGSFDVESSSGSGTTIYVRLPIAEARAPALLEPSVTVSAPDAGHETPAELIARAAAAIAESKGLTRQRLQLLQASRDIMAETRARPRGAGPTNPAHRQIARSREKNAR